MNWLKQNKPSYNVEDKDCRMKDVEKEIIILSHGTSKESAWLKTRPSGPTT